jgi:hypothetical protein
MSQEDAVRGFPGDIVSAVESGVDDIASAVGISGGLSGLASDIIQPVLSGILNEAAQLAEPVFNEIWGLVFNEIAQDQYFPALQQLVSLPTFLQQNFLGKIEEAADNIITQAFNAMYDAVAALITGTATLIRSADIAIDVLDLEVQLGTAALTIIEGMKDVIVTAAVTFSKDYATFVADVLTAETETAEFLANVESKFGTYIVGAVIKDATTYATGRINEVRNLIVRDINVANSVFSVTKAAFETPTYDPAPLLASFRAAANSDVAVGTMRSATSSATSALQAVPLPRTIARDLDAVVSQLEKSIDTGDSLSTIFRYGIIAVIVIYAIFKSMMFLR